jgi:hypothetical protein
MDNAGVNKALSAKWFVLIWCGFGARWAVCQATVHPDLQVYARAASVVDQSFEDLKGTFPRELEDVEFDESQSQLPSILERVSASIETFFRNFPNTSCREKVRQESLKPDGSVGAHLEQEYQYLIFMKTSDPGTDWEEDRADGKGHPIRPITSAKLPFLTSGYAMSSAYFHPSHRFGSRFRYLGRRRSAPHEHVIAFAQNPAMEDLLGRFIANVRVGTVGVTTKSVVTMVQGIAWIAPETFQIVRMRTDLLAPRPDVGLTRQTSEISYSEVGFPDITTRFWLPQDVTVTLEWQGQTYRNTHVYSEYRVFTVQSFDKVNKVGGAAAPAP